MKTKDIIYKIFLQVHSDLYTIKDLRIFEVASKLLNMFESLEEEAKEGVKELG